MICILQRVTEIQKAVDVLEALDQGLLSQDSNAIKGRTSMDVKFLQGRLNLNYLGMHGHSFGGATTISVCGLDKRFKCCVAEDVWWNPLEQACFEHHNYDFAIFTSLSVRACMQHFYFIFIFYNIPPSLLHVLMQNSGRLFHVVVLVCVVSNYCVISFIHSR